MENTKTIQQITLGWWPDENAIEKGGKALYKAVSYIQRPFSVVLENGEPAITGEGTGVIGKKPSSGKYKPIVALVTACSLENLGDRQFCHDHALQYPYVAGSMAHGINSCDIVESMAKNGMLAFFGSAGVRPELVEAAIDRLATNLPDKNYGFNLIHSPSEPRLEAGIVDLYLRKKVRLIEASAYLDMTLPVVKYRVSGIYRNEAGEVVTPNRIIAKVSRIELATKFFSPPPQNILEQLCRDGEITREQLEMAGEIPMAQDLTAEADSGGHTDNRPAITMLPTMLALCDRMQEKYQYKQKLRVGAAGGISGPASAAALFAMGAAYIVTGSINQACVESGTSDVVRDMLAQTRQADVVMAHAADMFEMGVKVQVVKRGTMFAMRSVKLYEIYNKYKSIEEIPEKERTTIEKQYFRASLDEIWNQTYEYFLQRDNTQITLAEKKPRYKMALIFRWYLSHASHWAISGEPDRKIDYQIWCGPAMGAFNEWTKDSFLQEPEQRKVAVVALNILYGAAFVTRLNALRRQGVSLGPEFNPRPLEIEHIRKLISN